MHVRIPDYAGGSLVNLIAEIETRLTGTAPAPPLRHDLAAQIPDGSTYIVLLVDGLGAHQLDHPAASAFADALIGTVDSPFPSTTTVSLSTVATGLPASRHGMLGHLVWMPGIGVMNGLKWLAKGGVPVDLDSTHFLPRSNVWERLAASGIEPITVQPGAFAGTKLTKALYRGARYESVWTHDEIGRAAIELASTPGRLIFVYMPDVDLAAHVFGQNSQAYTAAMRTAAHVWSTISSSLPDDVTLIGTADHGHVDYEPHDKMLVSRDDMCGLEVYGDPRALFLRGSPDVCAEVSAGLPGTWYPIHDIAHWWGPGPRHAEFDERAPTGILLVDDGHLVIPGHMDRRLIGYHGGLADAEREIPILVGG